MLYKNVYKLIWFLNNIYYFLKFIIYIYFEKIKLFLLLKWLDKMFENFECYFFCCDKKK